MATAHSVTVPDIGGVEVTVTEILVKVGDDVAVEAPLISVEGDKAAMEIPSPVAGVVKEIKVNVGDKVEEKALIAIVEEAGGEAPKSEESKAEAPKAEAPKAEAAKPAQEPAKTEEPAKTDAPAEAEEPAKTKAEEPAKADEPAEAEDAKSEEKAATEENVRSGAASATEGDASEDEDAAIDDAYAGPGVRKLARELGVSLAQVAGSGRKGRITPEDLKAWVKNALAKGAAAPATEGGGGVGGFQWPQMPKVDFAKFGPVEKVPLGRIRKVSATNLHRSWLHVPHVTQHDLADITEMEAFRKAHAEDAQKNGFKLTPLVFLLKASVAALRKFPDVNASLDPDGESLILKKYFHIGVAVDTPGGLVVPVIRDVDQKGLFALAKELGEVSAKARDGKLAPQDYQGAGFTISSLGGIGGTAFTPIVNAPEVAILGVSKASMQPVWQNESFVPRLMLPLSLSYDHRVIDGAKACRFVVELAGILADLRKLLL